MSLTRVLFILVPLLQLNVLAAEAFAANSRTWNSRELNFPRRTQQNAIVQPVHSIPRPLPKPIELTPRNVQEWEATTAPTENVYVDSQPSKVAIVRSNYQSHARQFNFPRRPVNSPQHVVVTQKPTVSPPIAIAPEPATLSPEPVEIASETPAIIYVSSLSTAAPQMPSEESADSDDIEVIVAHESPVMSTRRPPLRNHLNIAKPIPQPVNNGILISKAPKPAPEIISTQVPIRSVRILNTELEPKRDNPVAEIKPEEVELILPTISDKTEMIPEATQYGVISEPSTPKAEIIPKLVQPEINEPVYIVEEEKPKVIESVAPVKPVATIIEPQPTTVLVKEYTPERVNTENTLNNWRRRRPITRKPEIVTRPLPVSSPKPVSARIPPRVVPTKVTQPLIPTLNPITEPPSPKPSAFDKSLIPSQPNPIPVKPIPPTIPTLYTGKSIISLKTTTVAPKELMDYRCEETNGYYGISNECDSYVECKSFTAILYSCPDGLHFNNRAIWPEYPCAYPSEVKCESNSIKQKAQPTDQCPRQYGFFPMADSDCSRYIMCQEGYATVMNCPPGLVFNSGTSTCDWPENVPSCSPGVFLGFTCPAPPLEEDGTPSDMIFKYRYGQSCKEYVACQRGHPRLLSCDPDLSFDEEAEVCVDSEYVLNCRT